MSRAVVDRMLDEVERRGLEFAVAVVNSDGHIMAAGQTSGATTLNVRMAYKKAHTSAVWRADTKALHERMLSSDKTLEWLSDPLFTSAWGGVLLLDSDGAIIGAIGDSGTPENWTRK